MGTIRTRATLAEEMIDATLADSFPASDPPSWTLGRDRYRGKEPDTSTNETLNPIAREEFIMKTNIDLSDEQRDSVVKVLNTLLSDEYVLYTKTRNYHWNVVGPSSTTCTSSLRSNIPNLLKSWMMLRNGRRICYAAV